MVKLFVAGDVMIGRGVDQIMPMSVDPVLYEDYIKDARKYVDLAEQANGSIPRDVPADYVWGDALAAIDEAAPDFRIVNLETALTTHPNAWLGKPIQYRAHPVNVAVLSAAGIDCVAQANNHAMDWGHSGLVETLDVLGSAGMAVVGAGRTLAEASAPMVLESEPGGRVIVVGFASTNSGVPIGWAARDDRPGLLVSDDWSTEICAVLGDRLADVRRPGDVVVASVHWGSNSGWAIPRAWRRLAHALVDVGVDVVFGHSSHHVRPIELHRGRLILYGCGDFITDYEGIAGYEQYRKELVAAWFLEVDDSSGATGSVTMVPFESRRFRLERASASDAEWLATTLTRRSRPLGVRVEASADGILRASPI